MRSTNTTRRVVPVPAGIAWTATLQHRVYSCPDTLPYDFVFGATCLLLQDGTVGPRVMLNVEAVETCDPRATDFLDTVPAKFRTRFSDYVSAVHDMPLILESHGGYRFYFLSTEPWPSWLQALTTPEQCPDTEWAAVRSVWIDTEQFFEWPQVSAQLSTEFTRTDDGYDYPDDLLARLAHLGLSPGQRSNDPAILAFLASGGNRPLWGNEGWPIHHIYDGLAPFVPNAATTYAVQDVHSFTHSAGLVAAHPVAHHLVHQSPLLKWLLRREAYIRFGFDPDGAFNH